MGEPADFCRLVLFGEVATDRSGLIADFRIQIQRFQFQPTMEFVDQSFCGLFGSSHALRNPDTIKRIACQLKRF
jgi:hypothetical protein